MPVSTQTLRCSVVSDPNTFLWFHSALVQRLAWQQARDTSLINTLRPRQNGRHFADDIFKRIFSKEKVWISIKISLKFVPKGPINKIRALFHIMAWRRPGDKPLSEAMLVSLLTHKCVTRPQWVLSISAQFIGIETMPPPPPENIISISMHYEKGQITFLVEAWAFWNETHLIWIIG